jgi:recombination protein RecA
VEAIAKSAVRVASSRAFALVAIDLCPLLGLASGVRLDRWINVVRRLALAVEEASTTILLLTDASAHRALPLPVAMRLELVRDRERGTLLRVAKERHGRLTGFAPVDLGVPGLDRARDPEGRSAGSCSPVSPLRHVALP